MCPRRKMKTENYKNYGKCAVLEHGGVKVIGSAPRTSIS